MQFDRFPTRAWLFSPLFLLCAGCPPGNNTGTGTTTTTPATIAVAPVCALLATTSEVNPAVNAGTIAERTDASKPLGFVKLHRLSGPIGNSTVGFTQAVFALNEAWLHHPVSPLVFRAMAHPASRPQFNDFKGTAWSIFAQDNTGTWSRALVGSANLRNDQDDLAGGARAVPQFMPVGTANPQMFACVGGRNQDHTGRTTWLEEVKLDVAQKIPTRDAIQDVVNGDDRFIPNETGGPLRGPANPPSPTVHNPGNHVPQGAVQCAMTQAEDDVTTRELHMLTIDNGVLYHAMASNWGETTQGSFKFDRFRTVSQWAPVSQALGGQDFGYVKSAIIVAKPRMVSVFFVAQDNNNRYKLWHAVRFSANGGSWRNPVDDLLALSGGSQTGLVDEFKVAAGWCPIFGEEATGAPADEKDELLYVMYWPDETMTGGRIVASRRNWTNGVPGNYSPLTSMSTLLTRTSETDRNPRIESLSITTRPFADNAMPPAPPP